MSTDYSMYGAVDRFDDLATSIDNKVSEEKFNKSIKEVKDSITFTNDKLTQDIAKSKSAIIKEMNINLITVSNNLSANICAIDHKLDKSNEYFDKYKSDQNRINQNTAENIESIYNAIRTVSIVLALNMGSILGIIIYLTMAYLG